MPPFHPSASILSPAMRPTLFLPVSLAFLLLPSCGKKAQSAPPEMPPAAVSFLPAISETVQINRELPGRIAALRTAEVRARVAGILLQKTFQEGADVRAGDVLFQIDPAPLEAARDSAAANLARTDASWKQSETLANRARGLASMSAVSRQDAENAEAAVKVTAAEVLAAKAALKTAELNLGYATVTAPISGRIGRAQVTEGALVGQGNATLLAVIQQLDPVFFDFTQSSTDLISLKQATASGSLDKVRPGAAAVTLLLENGSEYKQRGRILFSEVSVDETTGMVSLRAEFPNPDRMLLPGMFARVRVTQAVRENAVTVPQRAVTHIKGGSGSVMVVDDSNHAQFRVIETSDAYQDKWVVTSGLKAGERVIIEGLLKARPGALVAPEPFVPAAQQAH